MTSVVSGSVVCDNHDSFVLSAKKTRAGCGHFLRRERRASCEGKGPAASYSCLAS